MPAYRWATLGCGVIGNELAQAMQNLGGSLYSVGNRTHEKALTFAEKYGIDDKCEYYLSYNVHEESFVKRVTGNLEEIYAKLARPLQVLENLRYADDK